MMTLLREHLAADTAALTMRVYSPDRKRSRVLEVGGSEG